MKFTETISVQKEILSNTKTVPQTWLSKQQSHPISRLVFKVCTFLQTKLVFHNAIKPGIITAQLKIIVPVDRMK